jgi:hypothetical protein
MSDATERSIPSKCERLHSFEPADARNVNVSREWAVIELPLRRE